MTNKIKLKVKSVFYNYEQGGRKAPVYNEYRTSILFGLGKLNAEAKGHLPIPFVDESLNSSGRFLDFLKEPVFNKEAESSLVFKNYNPRINKYLKPNEYFIIFEGARIVGKGYIVKILPTR